MEKYSTSAKVIDGTLILTIPDAITPVVWQMQLGQTKSSALEVRSQADQYLLVLKTPRADVVEIAPFDTKQKAIRAMMAASRAMERAHGQLSPSNGSANYPVPALIRTNGILRFLGCTLKWFLIVSLGLIAFLLLSSYILGFSVPTEQDLVNGQALYEQSQPAEVIGEPQSAEDFLQGQQ